MKPLILFLFIVHSFSLSHASWKENIDLKDLSLLLPFQMTTKLIGVDSLLNSKIILPEHQKVFSDLDPIYSSNDYYGLRVIGMRLDDRFKNDLIDDGKIKKDSRFVSIRLIIQPIGKYISNEVSPPVDEIRTIDSSVHLLFKSTHKKLKELLVGMQLTLKRFKQNEFANQRKHRKCLEQTKPPKQRFTRFRGDMTRRCDKFKVLKETVGVTESSEEQIMEFQRRLLSVLSSEETVLHRIAVMRSSRKTGHRLEDGLDSVGIWGFKAFDVDIQNPRNIVLGKIPGLTNIQNDPESYQQFIINKASMNKLLDDEVLHPVRSFITKQYVENFLNSQRINTPSSYDNYRKRFQILNPPENATERNLLEQNIPYGKDLRQESEFWAFPTNLNYPWNFEGTRIADFEKMLFRADRVTYSRFVDNVNRVTPNNTDCLSCHVNPEYSEGPSEGFITRNFGYFATFVQIAKKVTIETKKIRRRIKRSQW